MALTRLTVYPRPGERFLYLDYYKWRDIAPSLHHEHVSKADGAYTLLVSKEDAPKLTEHWHKEGLNYETGK